ncbi:MAG: M48 family metalloprotease [Rhodoferax sp.]|nr:M48 family metalloprotease [Rhodoferax sp.]
MTYLALTLQSLVRACLAAALLLCAVSGAHAQPAPSHPGSAVSATAGLPNLGDGTDMALSAERRLGDRIARELYRDPDYQDDPVIMEYVQSIWQPLLAAARVRGELTPEMDTLYAWEILLGRDRSVNAFALPGAYLGLHLGLVGVVSSRDELASVLAHELSHVTQRHISRMVARQSEQAPWLIGALILGMLAASKDPSGANAMIVGGQAVAAQTQLNFSRDMEREADRVGFGVSTQAGFAPQGFVSMFEKLQQASRLNDSGNFPYLRSHPLTTERISDMQARIPLPEAPTHPPAAPRPSVQSLEHSMIAARARVLSNHSIDALRTWAVEIEPAHWARLAPAQQAGALYGATFAALKQRDFSQARAVWMRLRDTVRGNPEPERLARLLGAELWLAQEDRSRALALLQEVPPRQGKDALRSRAELFLTAQAQQSSVPELAIQSLQTWVAVHPRDATAWQLLSTHTAAQGRTVASIRALAEMNVAQLDYQGALTRFKAAQDLIRKGASASDHIEASIIDTRARQVEGLVRELAQER